MSTLAGTASIETPKYGLANIVKALFGLGVLFMPYVFAWGTLLPGVSRKTRRWAFVWLAIWASFALLSNMRSAERHPSASDSTWFKSRQVVCGNTRFEFAQDGSFVSDAALPDGTHLRSEGWYATMGQILSITTTRQYPADGVKAGGYPLPVASKVTSTNTYFVSGTASDLAITPVGRTYDGQARTLSNAAPVPCAAI